MSLDINLTNVQSTPIVVSSNTTAENNKVYHVIANATFTDPTPVEGRGYFVVVRFASSCVLGGNSYISGETIHRIFHSGSWLNIALRPSTYESITNKKTTLTDNSDTFYPTQKAVKTAVDLKVDAVAGKGLSANDFTNTLKIKLDGIQDGAEVNVNADWNATSGDAQILNKPTIPSVSGLVPYTGATGDVDLGNNDLNAEGIKIKGTAGNGHLNLKHQSSGATAGGGESVIYADSSGNPRWKNDGNAVQEIALVNTILSKLGWFTYNRVAESTAVTGSTTETIIENIKINANTFASGGILRSYNNKFRKVGTSGSLTVRLYISPNNNSLTGATQIATVSIPSTNLFAEMLRTFTATTTSLIGWNSTTSSTNDVTLTTSARTETAVTWANDQYFIITVQLGSAGDSVSLIGASLKNF